MKDARRTQAGVEARWHEEVLLRLLAGDVREHPAKRALAIILLSSIADRCSSSGRCVNDAHGDFICEHATSEELGCPGWCERLGGVVYPPAPREQPGEPFDVDEAIIPF